MTENDISYKIRGAAFKGNNELGAGLFESVYEITLAYELKKAGLKVKTQVEIPIIYDNIKFNKGFKLDILVNDKVIIELKSVEKLAKVHFKQLLTYLKLNIIKLILKKTKKKICIICVICEK